MDDVGVRASPILPVADLERALTHYAAIGFTTSRHDDGYGFAEWAGLELHLVVDPTRGPAAVYVHVPDPDAVFAHLQAAGAGRTAAPVDKDYGIREGEHLDPDGNLLRFGCPIPSGP